MKKRKIIILTPAFLKVSSAPAIRWHSFIDYLKRFYDITIIEIKASLRYFMPEIQSIYIDKNIKVYNIIYKKSFPKLYILKKFLLGTKEAVFLHDIYYVLYKPLIDIIKDIIKHEKPDLLIASIPPPHLAVIAYNIYKEFSIPYIVDVRDLIEYFYFYEELPQRNVINRIVWISTIYNKYYMSLRNAQLITTVTPICTYVLKTVYKISNIYLIPNGITVAPDNLIHYKEREKRLIIIEAARSLGLGIEKIIKAWNNIVSIEFPDYKLTIIGGISELIKRKINTSHNIEILGELHFNEVIRLLTNSRGSIIWCLSSKNPAHTAAIPVKFYDSIGTGTPVYAQGPKSYLSILIEKYNLGKYHYKYCIDEKHVAEGLIDFIQNIERGSYDFDSILKIRKQFLRENYTFILRKIIDKLIT